MNKLHISIFTFFIVIFTACNDTAPSNTASTPTVSKDVLGKWEVISMVMNGDEYMRGDENAHIYEFKPYGSLSVTTQKGISDMDYQINDERTQMLWYGENGKQSIKILELTDTRLKIDYYPHRKVHSITTFKRI